MTPLGEELRALIASDGPMPVDRFMALALGHPRHGYYMSRDPFGADGDFVTAPEISQIFGELIGVWAASAWEALGRPASVRLIEFGPGRGTLMADLLRSMRALPAFHEAISVHLVEMSQTLVSRQRQTLARAVRPVSWHRDLSDIPEGPAIVIANEFLDALPVRQFVMTEHGWRERVIGVSEGALAFGLAPDPVPPAIIPEGLRTASPGAVFEIRPACASLAGSLAARTGPLAGLFIDYGYADAAHGETLQAVKAHRFVDPLAEPGEADITAHVDFAALARDMCAAGLSPGPAIPQRDLLFSLGIRERAEALVRQNPDAFESVRSGVERLIDPAPTGMGALFKAMVVTTAGVGIGPEAN